MSALRRLHDSEAADMVSYYAEQAASDPLGIAGETAEEAAHARPPVACTCGDGSQPGYGHCVWCELRRLERIKRGRI